MFLKLLAFIFLIPGVVTVYAARYIVSRFNLAENVKCDFEHEMGEEELRNYKLNKSVVNTKMLGLLIALPGLILLIVAFR